MLFLFATQLSFLQMIFSRMKQKHHSFKRQKKNHLFFFVVREESLHFTPQPQKLRNGIAAQL